MCGICGFINFKTNLVKNERENLAVAHRMAEKLRHRGPDSWGEWVGEHAVPHLHFHLMGGKKFTDL